MGSLNNPLFKNMPHVGSFWHIHKYTNTQIQHMTKCQKDPTCGIFLKRGLFKDIKNDIPMCQTCKYKIHIHKYTNTQIRHMTKYEKDPTCGIFLKRGLFKDIKNYIPMCRMHKYKNSTRIQEFKEEIKEFVFALHLKRRYSRHQHVHINSL